MKTNDSLDINAAT